MSKINNFRTKNGLKDDTINKLSPFVAVFVGLVIGAILLISIGENPFTAYGTMLQGAFKGIFNGNFSRFATTLGEMTPLIFTGLSVAFAFRTGLFNIGAAGQFLIGGYTAVYVGVIFELPVGVHAFVAIIAGTIAGALWGAIPGILKAIFNIHEVVISIMLNYTAMWLVQFLGTNQLEGAYKTETAHISETASLKSEWLTQITDYSFIDIGFFIAIATAVVVWIILEKTTFGYELKAVGHNKYAAEYAGMKVNRNIVASMAIAGGLAGLGGACYYLGPAGVVVYGVVPQFGFDGIAVSLLGMNSPFGVVLASLFFAIVRTGGGFLNTMMGVPKELVDVLMAVIIYMAATSILFKTAIKKYFSSVKVENDANAVKKDVENEEEESKGGNN